MSNSNKKRRLFILVDEHVHNPKAHFGLEVGEKAPFFEIEDVDGQLINIEALYSQQPVLLNFFRGHY